MKVYAVYETYEFSGVCSSREAAERYIADKVNWYKQLATEVNEKPILTLTDFRIEEVDLYD